MRQRFFAHLFVLSSIITLISGPAFARSDPKQGAVVPVHGHEAAGADSVRHWTRKWVLSLNGSQASYSNWSQGNNNSIAATGGNMFNATFKRARYSYDLLLNMRYGQTKINGSEVKKTDDFIHFRNRVDHLLHAKQYIAYVEVDFRTQFDAGYDKNNAYISDFMAPAYLIETVGLGYKPADALQFQYGLSLKQTFVADSSLSRRYGVAAERNFRSEGGFSLGANFKSNVAKNLTLNSSVQTFTNFLQDLEHTDMMFSNELSGKVNSFMNTNIQFVLMYDRDFNTKIQVKQVLAVGLSFNVF